MKITAQQSTLLDYVIDTVPDPLQASPDAGDAVMAALTLIVSNSTGKPVNVSTITVSLPTGTGSDALTTIPNAAAIMVAADPERLWNVTPSSTAGFYLIQPASGQPITIKDTGVVFQFFNIVVNTAPGTFIVNIGEMATQTTEMPAAPPSTQVKLTKFPYGFFFSNLVPSAPAVSNGGQVTLTWQGSTQARYFMLFNDQTVDVSNLRSWTSPVLNRDTTFLLKAVSESYGQTVSRGLSTTVNVYNPDLQAASLTVAGNTSITGDTNIKGNANITGDTNINGGLTVAKTTNMAELNLSGHLQSQAGANFNNLLVYNYSYLQGPVEVFTQLKVRENLHVDGNAEISGYLNAAGYMYCPWANIDFLSSGNANFTNTSTVTASVGSWQFFQNQQQFLQGNFNNRPVLFFNPAVVVIDDEQTASTPPLSESEEN